MTRTAVSGGSDLGPDFLTRALAAHLDGAQVVSARATPVGTGQVSDSFRLRLTYDRETAGASPEEAAAVATDLANRERASDEAQGKDPAATPLSSG